jgi:hypothetical protein
MAAKAERKKRVVDVEARLFLDSIFSKVEDFAIVLEEALLVFFCAFAPNAASARSNNDLLDFFSIRAATPATRSSSPESYVCAAGDETRMASASSPKSQGESSLSWWRLLVKQGVGGWYSLLLAWTSAMGLE